jgi:Helix-turn-helix domain
MQHETFLSVEELAKRSHESEAVWRKRIYRREIACVKCGRNVRVRLSDFEVWVERRLVPAQG